MNNIPIKFIRNTVPHDSYHQFLFNLLIMHKQLDRDQCKKGTEEKRKFYS